MTLSLKYLEWRFDKKTRLLGSACFTLQMVLYMAIVVYTPALALSQGMSSILYREQQTLQKYRYGHKKKDSFLPLSVSLSSA